MTEKPHRAFTLELKIGADTRKDLIDTLFCFATGLERGELSGEGVSGGYSSGWIYKIEHDPEMTHDRYVEALDRYLGNRK